ncbi:hypothetical protein NPIL_344891 [Nephila pilipes]|uniref:Uncharacterized protein n=1 Tax=Nephila pilipes TaxID=299642 RepID=A0A8X6TSY2_NEPPI|nr:hypothetical protein NPIL_344891 [Nephila pilipes]
MTPSGRLSDLAVAPVSENHFQLEQRSINNIKVRARNNGDLAKAQKRYPAKTSAFDCPGSVTNRLQIGCGHS